MRCLAFDLGGSGGKLFTGTLREDRLIVAPVYDFPNRFQDRTDGLFWDLAGIRRHMALGIQKASADGAVDSFGADSFNNDFALLDASGIPMLPMRCYRDSRMVRCSDRIYDVIPREKLYSYTGNQLASFNTFMQLASMCIEGEGHILKQADTMLLLSDLLGYDITGAKYAEYTAAAETQFLDTATHRWIPEVLNAFDIPTHLLPQVVEPGTVVGRATESFCLKNGIRPFDHVAVCQHDTASAFAATAMEDSAIISSGTWSLIGLLTPGPVITDQTYRYNIANEGGLPGKHRLLKNVMGMWILQELLREYAADGLVFSYAQTQELAAQAPAFAYLFDPDAPEFFQPGQMLEKIRSACHSAWGRAPQTPGEVFRTVYECLALRSRYALERLEEVTGQHPASVNVLGGGSRDAFACRCLAGAMGRPVYAGPANATAIGNLLVQLAAHGQISMAEAPELIRRSFQSLCYEPENSPLWNAHYEAFLEKYHL